MTTAKPSAGFNEAEGYAASLRQQASWIEESPAAEMIDADELRSAANFIERLASPPSVPGVERWWLKYILVRVRSGSLSANAAADAILALIEQPTEKKS